MDKRPFVEKDKMINYYDKDVQYYIDTYSPDSAEYPANKKRLEIVLNIMKLNNIRSILDIGCGPCIPMVHLLKLGREVRGVDYSEEMIKQGRIELEKRGYDKNLISVGDVEDVDSLPDGLFHGVIALGVFPHLNKDELALRNIYKKLHNRGITAIEFRNDLFALFTFNKYSYEFFIDRMMDIEHLSKDLQDKLRDFLRKRFDITSQQLDVMPSTQIEGDILKRFHNPLNIRELFSRCEFEVRDIYFYHYHCLPPVLQSGFEDEFYKQSLILENPTDWRGYFMASAFVVEAVKK